MRCHFVDHLVIRGDDAGITTQSAKSVVWYRDRSRFPKRRAPILVEGLPRCVIHASQLFWRSGTLNRIDAKIPILSKTGLTPVCKRIAISKIRSSSTRKDSKVKTANMKIVLDTAVHVQVERSLSQSCSSSLRRGARSDLESVRWSKTYTRPTISEIDGCTGR